MGVLLGASGAVADLSGPTAVDRTEPPADEARLELVLDGYSVPESPSAKPWNDLLEHLRQGFTLEHEMNDRVRAEMRWYLRHPDYLTRVFQRAQRYLPHITAELDARDLPLELALLPIVESAFDPFAYSHGRAAGLWQIIPGTGRRFGLKQNWWYDGRRDVVESTRAALDYLTTLHEMMDGDWLLAVASYNSGEGNVLRAARRNRQQGKPDDFWNLRLSRETSAYVPRLLALAHIVKDPAAFELTLPALTSDAQFVTVDIESQLDLATAADLAALDLETLYAFNAGLNRWATDPEGPHRLLVPSDAAARFVTALETLPASERVRWKRHKIASGETISEIAELHGTTVRAVRAANNLRGNTIRAGRHLMIPMSKAPLSAYSKSADVRRRDIQNKSRRGTRVDHVVAPGESFWSIGQKYGVGTRELAAWNGMAPRDTLSIGQSLVVWASSPPPTRNGNGLTRKLHYKVRRGDSLSGIAARFRVRVSDLVRWNSLDPNAILRPGQSLSLYVDVTRQSS